MMQVGDRVNWQHTPRGGYGYSVCVAGIVTKIAAKRVQIGVVSENGIYGHSRFCNTDFDDKLACLNLSGV